MKFAHTGDLHIGKRLHERSLLEDQRIVLWQILDILCEEEVEVLVVSGDIYDKPTPGVDAVKLFDEFVYELERKNIKLIAISGNHDSMERISFGSRIMSKKGIFFQENFSGEAQKIVLSDSYGEINFYLIPFIKPAYVGSDSYEEAFAKIVASSNIDFSKRNVLVAHQFFTGTKLGMDLNNDMLKESGLLPERTESEAINVGGLDNISYELVKDFDYVALGHLHKSQCVGEDYIRYSGSPLKYSFSESNHEKSIVIVDVKSKGDISINKISLEMPRDLRVIKGKLENLVSKDVVEAEGVSREDYICAVITDKERVTDAANKLLRWYPNLLKIEYEYDNVAGLGKDVPNIKGKSPMQLFEEYYEMINGRTMDSQEMSIVAKLLGGDKDETN